MPNPSELERMRQENEDEMRRVSGHVDRFGDGSFVTTEKTRENFEADLAKEMEDFDNGRQTLPAPSEFERKLEKLINELNIEGCGGDTPDFILARFLRLQLSIFDSTVRRREHWYGRGNELVDTAMLRQEAQYGR